MSVHTKWREEFIAEAGKAGLRIDVIRAVLRLTKTLHRLAEAQCNGDYPYANGSGGNQYNGWTARAGKDCPICGDNWAIESVKRNGCPECRAQARMREVLKLTPFRPVFSGDPRGCVVHLVTFSPGEPGYMNIGVPA